ncbi:hypothetical protein PYCC9005_003249 [Savitreella phatthalungensis]
MDDFLNLDEAADCMPQFSRQHPHGPQLRHGLDIDSGFGSIASDENDSDMQRALRNGSWQNMSDNFSNMHVVKQEHGNDGFLLNTAWPGAMPNAGHGPESGMNIGPMDQDTMRAFMAQMQQRPMNAADSFCLSQIVPPSLPNETSTDSAISMSSASMPPPPTVPYAATPPGMTHDMTHPASKRRASNARKDAMAAGVATTPMRGPTSQKRSASSNGLTPTALPDMSPINIDLGLDPAGAKRQDRLMRNRAAALASRERKREHVSKLEGTVNGLEQDRFELQKQVITLLGEIDRLKNRFALMGIHEIERPDVAAIRHSTRLEDPKRHGKKVIPTGFSPRGALKKDEIIANQLAAEQHLRDVTQLMGQQSNDMSATSSLKHESSNDSSISTSSFNSANTSPPSSAPSQRVNSDSPANVGAASAMAIMVLAYGVALSASVTPQQLATLNIGGMKAEQTVGSSPRDIVANLCRQGFMPTDHMDESRAAAMLSSDQSRQMAMTEAAQPLRDWLVVGNSVSRGLQIQLASRQANGQPASFNLISVDDHATATTAATGQRKSKANLAGSTSPSPSWTVLECQVKSARKVSAPPLRY